MLGTDGGIACEEGDEFQSDKRNLPVCVAKSSFFLVFFDLDDFCAEFAEEPFARASALTRAATRVSVEKFAASRSLLERRDWIVGRKRAGREVRKV